MIILGIDPGTRRIGFGVVEYEGGRCNLRDAGILAIREKINDQQALEEVSRGIKNLIQKYRPDAAAVEKIFFSKNQKTAIEVAQARGVILAIMVESHVPAYEYSPNEIKLSVTGNGNADKKSVAKMVALILKQTHMKLIDDASDALAAALCAGQQLKFLTKKKSTLF